VILSQIFVIITATAYQVVVVSAQGLGSHTSITDGSTWKDYTDCSQSYDAPFYAYFTFAATQILTLVMIFIAISPHRCGCLHLVAFDDNMDVAQSFSSRQIPIVDAGPDFLRGESSTVSSFADSKGAYYDSGIDYRMSLALIPETLSSYSPPQDEDPSLEKY
jgi:hypothetical protein